MSESIYGAVAAYAQDLIDDGLADLQSRMDAGGDLNREEQIGVLGQLIQDRQRLRALIERGGSVIQ